MVWAQSSRWQVYEGTSAMRAKQPFAGASDGKEPQTKMTYLVVRLLGPNWRGLIEIFSKLCVLYIALNLLQPYT